ncbi:hypothetical protein SARC_00239 [Sphaeroforma arctica JP610]|uniref:UDENN domain-containing protein n=1 Tax=Sphaeroforma arctica JP610 TaxID=667725 RepID=A0A0L0GH65_9EUKA|nr:hypothetical protein SARC_00239 [Sphaeroforma arctica JP610]KNC87668.1 hypothetical protein SARC_00239 [Sphaeroforma arctica JP610]|eukprot:XP_014161570.1 hypothetical protein SARC_00239 [Sphaeroforma arctica JP610]
MQSQWDRLASFFLVVGAGEDAQSFDPTDGAMLGRMFEDEGTKKAKDPITDIVVVEADEPIPDNFEVAGVVSNKPHIRMAASSTLADSDMETMESANDYFVCVSRDVVDMSPITQLVYTTVQDGHRAPEMYGFEVVSSPVINLTPIGDKDTIWCLYMKRESTRMPIIDVLVEPEEGITLSGTTKVENATFSTINLAIYVQYMEEFPRIGVTYVPRILTRFPACDTKETSVPPAVTGFCFPNGVEYRREYANPLFFTFVLTDEKGVMQYGSCYTVYERKSFVKQRNARVFHEPKCICILSRWPFFCSYRRYIQALFTLLKQPCAFPIESYIVNLFEASVPPQGDVITNLRVGDSVIEFARPAATDFPLANYSLLPLFHALDLPNIATVLCLILTEAKLLIQSQHISLLTPICESLTSLIFPLRWQHIYVPLCPPSFLDFLQAPVPFIIGVQAGVVDFSVLPTDVYLVDIDNNRIQKKKDDYDDDMGEMPSLPAQSHFLDRLYSVASHLFIKGYTSMEHVENHPYTQPGSVTTAHKTAEQVRQEAIRESFLDFFVSILKPYREYLTVPTADTIHEYAKIFSYSPEEVFNKEAFLMSVRDQDRKFMDVLVDSQAFTHFVEQRSFISNRDEELLFFDMCIDEANYIEEKQRLESEAKAQQKSHGRMTSVGSARNLLSNFSQTDLFAGRSAVDIRSWGNSSTSGINDNPRKLGNASSVNALDGNMRGSIFSPNNRSSIHMGSRNSKRDGDNFSRTNLTLNSRPSSRERITGHMSLNNNNSNSSNLKGSVYGLATSPVAAVRVQPSYARPHVAQEPQLPPKKALKRCMPIVLGAAESNGTADQHQHKHGYDNDEEESVQDAMEVHKKSVPPYNYRGVFPPLQTDLFPRLRQATRFNADALHAFDRQSALNLSMSRHHRAQPAPACQVQLPTYTHTRNLAGGTGPKSPETSFAGPEKTHNRHFSADVSNSPQQFQFKVQSDDELSKMRTQSTRSPHRPGSSNLSPAGYKHNASDMGISANIHYSDHTNTSQPNLSIPAIATTSADYDTALAPDTVRMKANTFFISLHETWLYLFSVRLSSMNPAEVPAAFHLAESILNRMRTANIRPSEGCYRLLLVSCARIGGYAAQARYVFQMMSRDGIVANAITTGLFVRANLQAPGAGLTLERQSSNASAISSVSRYPSLQRQRSGETVAGAKVGSGGGSSSITHADAARIDFSDKKLSDPPQQYGAGCLSNWSSLKELQVAAMEFLPMHLASMRVLARARVESNNTCPHCHALLTDEEISLGWEITSYDSTSVCVYCHSPFIPELSFSYTGGKGAAEPTGDNGPSTDGERPGTDAPAPAPAPESQGADDTGHASGADISAVSDDSQWHSTGQTTAPAHDATTDSKPAVVSDETYSGSTGDVYTLADELEAETNPTGATGRPSLHSGTCPYLSPTVLFHELDIAFYRVGFEATTDPQLDVNLHRDHPTLFWNIVWYFTQLRLPILSAQDAPTPPGMVPSNEDMQIFRGFDEPAIRYDDKDASLHVHVRVNGLGGRLAGVPFCRTNVLYGLPEPARVRTNKHGIRVLRDIHRVGRLVRRKRLQAAIEHFLIKRQEYVAGGAPAYTPSPPYHTRCSADKDSCEDIDLSAWFACPLYYALLTCATYTAHPDEEKFYDQFQAALKALPNQLASSLRRPVSGEKFTSLSGEMYLVDTAPSENTLIMRSILGMHRPRWSVESTHVIKQCTWFDYGVL